MKPVQLIALLLISVFSACSQNVEKSEIHHGVLVRSFDKAKEYPVEGYISIDFEERTNLYADDGWESPNRLLLLPDKPLFDLLASRMELPADWLAQRDSLASWLSVAPSVPSSSPSRLEKIVPVTFDVIKVDSSQIGGALFTMLVSDYSVSGTDFTQAELYLVNKLSKAETLPTD